MQKLLEQLKAHLVAVPVRQTALDGADRANRESLMPSAPTRELESEL